MTNEETPNTAHSVVASYLCGEIRLLAKEMQRVAVLLNAAGYENKYIEMSGASTMAEEWADGIDEDVQINLFSADIKKLDALMQDHKRQKANQVAKNAVDIIEDFYSMEIAEPDCWQAIREGLGMPAKRLKV